jgi:hypothetical protein
MKKLQMTIIHWTLLEIIMKGLMDKVLQVIDRCTKIIQEIKQEEKVTEVEANLQEVQEEVLVEITPTIPVLTFLWITAISKTLMLLKNKTKIIKFNLKSCNPAKMSKLSNQSYNKKNWRNCIKE